MTRYDETTKSEAIALALELEDVAEAARRMNLPRQTVHRWCRDEGVTVTYETRKAAVAAASIRWEERRATITHRFGDLASLALDAVERGLTTDDVRTAKDAATTAAILVDKAQLLSGGATGRVYVPPEHAGKVVDDARTVGLSLVSGDD